MLIPKHSKKSINIVKVGWLKKNKPASLKSLRKKAWALQSEYVRRSENGICYTCGSHNEWKNTQCGHYIHGNWMDFILMNLHCQCIGCNHFKSGNGTIYAERMIAEYGEQAVAELRTWSQQNKNKKYNIFELEELIAKYKALLAEMGKD
jgi:hypothetical protein